MEQKGKGSSSHLTVLDKALNKKLIVTHYQNGILIALSENEEIVELQYEDDNSENFLGNIYVGRVEQVVKNIDAAFISFGKNQKGYYSLKDNRYPYFLNKKQNTVPLPGDLLLIQVEKDAVKTKDVTLTSNISLTGRYAVLTVGNTSMSISGKIRDNEWKERCRTLCRPYCTDTYGFIVRTNAYTVPFDDIIREIKELGIQYELLKKEALYRNAHTLIYKAPSSCLKNLRDVCSEDLTEIITDIPVLHEQMKAYLTENSPALLDRLVLYEDSLLPLFHLYSLGSVTEQAIKSRVWLKSGAYLVIEPTEALTVIDVNTGKCIAKKNVEEMRLAINKEAAKEIAKQLRLRNLSGIIIVDFINMDSSEAEKELFDYFSSELRKDPVKTFLAGMTTLGLAEVTRKKIKKPFMEQLKIKQSVRERE